MSLLSATWVSVYMLFVQPSCYVTRQLWACSLSPGCLAAWLPSLCACCPSGCLVLSDFVCELVISCLPLTSVNWLLATCLSVSLMPALWLTVALLFVAWLHLLITCQACELATFHLAACQLTWPPRCL